MNPKNPLSKSLDADELRKVCEHISPILREIESLVQRLEELGPDSEMSLSTRLESDKVEEALRDAQYRAAALKPEVLSRMETLWNLVEEQIRNEKISLKTKFMRDIQFWFTDNRAPEWSGTRHAYYHDWLYRYYHPRTCSALPPESAFNAANRMLDFIAAAESAGTYFYGVKDER